MRFKRVAAVTAALLCAVPAYAAASTGEQAVPSLLSTGVGVVALVASIVLLIEMLALRKLAEGSAVSEHLSYAVLGVLCLTASVLTGWLSKYIPNGLSAAQARLGTDLLIIAAIAFFGVYFARVRRAMSRFLRRLTGEEQLIATIVDPDHDME